MVARVNNPVKIIVKSFPKHQYVYLESRTAQYNCWSDKKDKEINGHYVNDKALCYYFKGLGLEFGAGAFDLAGAQNPCDLPLCGEVD